MRSLDESNIDEGWVNPGKLEEAIKVVEDWDPVVKAIISCTPPGASCFSRAHPQATHALLLHAAEGLLDWKLVRRTLPPHDIED